MIAAGELWMKAIRYLSITRFIDIMMFIWGKFSTSNNDVEIENQTFEVEAMRWFAGEVYNAFELLANVFPILHPWNFEHPLRWNSFSI